MVDTTEEEAWQEYASYIRFHFAIMATFAWLVPAISIRIGKFRDAVTNLVSIEEDDEEDEKERQATMLEQRLRAVRRGSGWSIVSSLTVLSLLAVWIGLMTQQLDDRMHAVLQGFSRLMGAWILFLISIRVPKWFGGVNYFERWRHGSVDVCGQCCDPKVLQFNVFWEVMLLFSRECIYILPFFCGVDAVTIPCSIIAGIVFGMFVDMGVYVARRQEKIRRKRIAFWSAIMMVGLSSLLFSDGVFYIATVWGSTDDDRRETVWLGSLLAWLLVGILFHVCLWRHAIKRLRELHRENSGNNRGSFIASLRDSTRMATSMIIERIYADKLPNDVRQNVEHMDQVNESSHDDIQENENGKSREKEPPKNDLITGETDNEAEDVYGYEGPADGVPSTLSLVGKNVLIFGCVRGKDKTKIKKARNCLGWLFGMFCLVIVIFNIGATVQGDGVRANLPAVNVALYDRIDEGPVCAFDNKGADSNITTFPDKEAAHAAGFLILHCGACGHCSDWHNLRLEYTTRNYLAKESARCARKSLFGGRDAVTRCLEKEPIGFRGECAECWTTDILCTKEHCVFIFLQSTLINAVGDFAVGPDTVTSASCEEAFCEVGQFVPCSGATRRRMNVTSSIVRPGLQRCSIVDVVWEDLFPE